MLRIPQYHLLGYPGRCADCKRASKHSGENGKRKAKHKEAEWREKAKANGVLAQTCHSLVAAPLQTDLPQDLGNVARCRHNALQRQQHCNILSCLCILHAFTNDLSRNPANIFRNQLAQHSSPQPTCYTPTILFDCILCLFHSYTALCYASRIKYLHSNKSFTVGLITKSAFTCSEPTVWSTWQVTFLALIKRALLFHWEIALSPNKRFALFSHNNLLLQTISNSGVIDWHLRVPLK